MKLLIDFLPIVIFFAVYKYTGDIIIATAVLIPATILQISYVWLRTKKIEKMHLITLGFVLVLGGATIIFNDKTFIQWKPTIVNFIFALALLGSQIFAERSIIERMFGNNLEVPKTSWRTIGFAWVLFFIFSGLLNLYVAYNFSEEDWVNFKLFGLTGLSFIAIFLTIIYLYPHLKKAEEEAEAQNKAQINKQDP
ncbi:septation protein A [Litoribacillus peritrichatus]|uniref:Inner membrane-spanning protein YciB n=1 Tax=Litoribacillus peritrichatus TaxID=718191 RepID=A0ABP7MDH4_9GAMM